MQENFPIAGRQLALFPRDVVAFFSSLKMVWKKEKTVRVLGRPRCSWVRDETVDRELLGASDASGPASCELGFVTSWSKPHMAPSYPQPTARLEPSLGPLRPPGLCSAGLSSLTWGHTPTHRAARPWVVPGPLRLQAFACALPPLPLSFFPPQPCLLSSWLPFPWVGLVPPSLC